MRRFGPDDEDLSRLQREGLLTGASPLDRAGTRRLVLRLNQGRSIVETDYANNTATSGYFFMGEVVNVLMHGFNPFPPPYGKWEVFRKPFYELTNVLNNAPKPGTAP